MHTFGLHGNWCEKWCVSNGLYCNTLSFEAALKLRRGCVAEDQEGLDSLTVSSRQGIHP